jgi:hypothetical protein
MAVGLQMGHAATIVTVNKVSLIGSLSFANSRGNLPMTCWEDHVCYAYSKRWDYHQVEVARRTVVKLTAF